MLTKEYLALRAGRMLVGKHLNKGHGDYVIFDETGKEYTLPWKEVYEILSKMIVEREGDAE